MCTIIITSTDLVPEVILLPTIVCNEYPKHNEWIFKCCQNKRPALILLSKDKEVVGCTIIKESKQKKSVKIGYFYILPECRNKNYGTKLLKATEEFAVNLNCNFIYTRIKNSNNIAQSFILKHDYKKIATTNIEEIVYSKEISGE